MVLQNFISLKILVIDIKVSFIIKLRKRKVENDNEFLMNTKMAL